MRSWLAVGVLLGLAGLSVAPEQPELARAPRGEAEIARARATLRSLYPRFDPEAHRVVLVNPNASDLLPQRRWMPDASRP